LSFEWDDPKAAANLRKHGVSFDEAENMFAAAAFFEDFDHSEAEPRYLAIGFSAKGRMLTVVFTRPAVGVYRIVSARKANKREQQRYGKAKSENS
jgi:uncharacterized protein